MGNRKKLDLAKLTRVLAKPPAPRPQPDRRVRACCGSRQGFPHFGGCGRRKADGPALPATTEAELLEAAWGVIANAGWDGFAKTDGWQAAAERWRDDYHRWLDKNREGQR